MAGMAGPRKRRQYSKAEREKVLAAVTEVGVAEAGCRHGIPQTTVSSWLSRSAAKRPAGAKAKKARASASMATIAADEQAPSSTSMAATKARPQRSGVSAGKRVARLYTPSQKAEVLEHAATKGVSAASKNFGASRFSIYEWKRKLGKAAKGEGPSPTSGSSPKEIEAAG